ncbi:MAG: hypothetical protein HQL18_05565 [Candidatus Omnitrophica bacterium]|nr:hypothetical protein [Candidatus Omnitrophota bacterium]
MGRKNAEHDGIYDLNILEQVFGIPMEKGVELLAAIRAIKTENSGVPREIAERKFDEFWKREGFRAAAFYSGAVDDMITFAHKAEIYFRQQKARQEAGTGQSAQAGVKNDNSQDVGGIDLNTAGLQWITRGNAGNFEVELTPQQIQMLERNITGFVPVITDVQPVESVPMFLGMRGQEKIEG